MYYNPDEKWYFDKEVAFNSPSHQLGLSIEKESFYRQSCASFIQDMGQQLKINQTAINTAIVFMHRFYCFQTFQDFPRNDMAVTCLLLASKVEEQFRAPVDIYIVFHRFLYKEEKVKEMFRTKNHPEAERFNRKIVSYEKALFMTLNSEILITHANEFVLICSLKNGYPSDVTQTAYFLATNSLHLTRYCIIYPPEFIACVALYLAGEWASFQLQTNEDPTAPRWYDCVACNVRFVDIRSCALEFLEVMEKCPSRIKRILQTGPILSNVNDITLLSKSSNNNNETNVKVDSSLDTSKIEDADAEVSSKEVKEGSIDVSKTEPEIMSHSYVSQGNNQIPIAQTNNISDNHEGAEVSSVCFRLKQAWNTDNISKTDKKDLNKSLSGGVVMDESAILSPPKKRNRRSFSHDLSNLSPSQQNTACSTARDDFSLTDTFVDKKMFKSSPTYDSLSGVTNLVNIDASVTNIIQSESESVNTCVPSSQNELENSDKDAMIKCEEIPSDITTHGNTEKINTTYPPPQTTDKISSSTAEDTSNFSLNHETGKDNPTETKSMDSINPTGLSLLNIDNTNCRDSNPHDDTDIEQNPISDLTTNENDIPSNSISEFSPSENNHNANTEPKFENNSCNPNESTVGDHLLTIIPQTTEKPSTLRHLSEGECEDSDSLTFTNENPD